MVATTTRMQVGPVTTMMGLATGFIRVGLVGRMSRVGRPTGPRTTTTRGTATLTIRIDTRPVGAFFSTVMSSLFPNPILNYMEQV